MELQRKVTIRVPDARKWAADTVKRRTGREERGEYYYRKPAHSEPHGPGPGRRRVSVMELPWIEN